jgi:hypothetical protein
MTNNLSLGLQEGRPSYRRSLQHSYGKKFTVNFNLKIKAKNKFESSFIS